MISTKLAPCYLCHGEKLIRVPQPDGDLYYGCPACKRRGEVIGEGFSFLAGAETPGLYRLAVAVCQDDRARILAERYGLEFNGMQELPRGGEAFTFTCLVTGTTFLIHELADLEPKLRRIRAQFEPRKTGRDKCAE